MPIMGFSFIKDWLAIAVLTIALLSMTALCVGFIDACKINDHTTKSIPVLCTGEHRLGSQKRSSNRRNIESFLFCGTKRG